jgi:hypothetical protein
MANNGQYLESDDGSPWNRASSLQDLVHGSREVFVGTVRDGRSELEHHGAYIRTLSFAKTPRQLSFIHVTCYMVSLYVIDFKRALNFDEVQQ